jgi:hypothetical protein
MLHRNPLSLLTTRFLFCSYFRRPSAMNFLLGQKHTENYYKITVFCCCSCCCCCFTWWWCAVAWLKFNVLYLVVILVSGNCMRKYFPLLFLVSFISQWYNNNNNYNMKKKLTNSSKLLWELNYSLFVANRLLKFGYIFSDIVSFIVCMCFDQWLLCLLHNFTVQ